MKIVFPIIFLAVIGASANAQFTSLIDFGSAPNGKSPSGSLISDGSFLYGMTTQGGVNNDGTIFKIKPDGTGYSKLLDFNGANGKSPYGSLISDGVFLYGMAEYGGANNMGLVFKIKPDGSGFVDVLDFSSVSNGSYPFNSLISDGTFLYGMTQYGGVNNDGTIFKIKPDGTGYSKLLDFSGALNGQYPSGNLFSDGTFLYGMTNGGGANNDGVIFKIKPDGTGYADMLDFAGATNGKNPNGSLISDGTFLYGITTNGGTKDSGAIFKIKPDGTGYSRIYYFTKSNGYFPTGSLVSDGVFLYGIATRGGTGNDGLIFKIKPDGTGYSVILNFSGISNGSYPSNSLISDGTFLYGMTLQGGLYNNYGTIFKIKYDGSGYSKLLDFFSYEGCDSWGSLVSDGTFLYGMSGCGVFSNGIIFKILPDGTGYSKLFDFGGGVNGSSPMSSLIYDGTYLYGMVHGDGTLDSGIIFKIKPDGTGFSKMYNFTKASGYYPWGSLISDGTFLYGMTKYGGSKNGGVIFKIKSDGTGYIDLYNFGSVATDGYSPTGSLYFDGTFLYGMTPAGGASYLGTIFKIKPDGTGYSKLWDFAGTAINSNPNGSLISDGIFLYGMTSIGGANNQGVIFKIKPDGTGYLNLNIINGVNPRGDLIFNGNFLYGMTPNGGIGGYGNIFKIKSDGTGFSDRYDFGSGATPYGSLITDGTFFYGMTVGDGVGGGTVFKYRDTTSTTCNLSITNNITICAGQNTTLSASGGVSYSWSTGNTTTSIIVSPTATTGYTVTATTGTCVATATVSIDVNPTPTANFSASSIILGNPMQFTDLSTGNNTISTWFWDFGDGNTSSVQNPSHTYTASGTYTACVSVWNNWGCKDSSCQAITVSPTSVNELENLSSVSITPNPASGVFVLEVKNKKYEIIISNIFGEKIFQSSVLNSKSEIDISSQPSGIYFMRIKSEEGTAVKKLIVNH